MKRRTQKLINLTYWSLFLFIAFMALGVVMNQIEAYDDVFNNNNDDSNIFYSRMDTKQNGDIQIKKTYNKKRGNSHISKNGIEEINPLCSLDAVICENEIKPIKLLTDNPDIETKIREIADKENFKWSDYLVKLAYCESRLNPKATNDNGKYGLDRGIFQINNKYHPTVTDAQALDIDFATRWTINKINGGYQHLWACDSLIKRNLVKL